MLAWTTKRKPADGSTHWSSRKLAAELGGDMSHMTVPRIWAKHGLKPHRLEGYIASNDPDFETKAADMIGLYLNPPQHAAVFCVDEKTAIQALDRKDPVLPLSPGRAERHGFEYFRHGTLSLYAAFNAKTGEVLGKTAERHTSAEFVAFLTEAWSISRGARRSMSSLTISRRTRPSSVEEFLAGAPERSLALHSDLLVMVEPGRAVVRQDRARCDRSRRVHFGRRPQEKTHALHPPVQQTDAKPVKWKYFDPITSNCSRFNRYRPLGTGFSRCGMRQEIAYRSSCAAKGMPPGRWSARVSRFRGQRYACFLGESSRV